MERTPVVAGQFYEGTRAGLMRSIEKCFLADLGPGSLPEKNPNRIGRISGLVCPHAGYMYSGMAAAHAFGALAQDGIPDTAVLLGPNHYGLGAGVAISPDEVWVTPLGPLQADKEAIERILNLSKYAELDELGHMREHSLEVQLPFLQYIGGTDTKIVPITIAHLNEDDALKLIDDLGTAIAKALECKSAVVIASTDFTHYEPKSTAEARDALAIEQISKLDGKGLIRTVYSKSITMCGVVGTAVMLEACKRLGANSAQKLTYYTSGDITGDTTQVVGYGALSIKVI